VGKMATVAYGNEGFVATRHTNWSAIWAGMFTFAAIWSIFGVLGEAIFTSSANPHAGAPVSGMSIGMGVWAVILTIIALYFGGRVTGGMAAVISRGEGATYGTVMFGLSVIATLVVMLLAGAAAPAGGVNETAGSHSAYMFSMLSEMGWIGFFSLFLGWLAAMGGAASAVKAIKPANNVRDIRPAA
jgi:hypothetical protein